METKLFENMAFYEIILLILGCLLFLVALVGIIINMVRREPLKKYIPLIFIAIVMIGFAGIKKVSFMNDFISLEKYSKEYENNPSNQEALMKLTDSYNNIKRDKIQSPQESTTFAKAAMLLGDNETSINFANKAIEKDNNNSANEIKMQVESNMVMKQIMMDPENEGLKSDLNMKLHVLENRPDKTPYQSLKVAEGNLLTGNIEKAKDEANKVIAQNPGENQARQILKYAQVEEEIRRVEENPANREALSHTIKNIQEPQSTPRQNAFKNVFIARAYKALGDPQKSEKYRDSTRFYLNKH